MKKNKTLFEKAKSLIPGGVNSPVRAFKAVGGTPVFFAEGKGAWLVDVEQKKYIDYVSSWGPAILGHAYPDVVRAVQQVVEKGIGFGASHTLELELAEVILSALPSIEQVRFVNSGTEAAMTAIRLARGYTKRNRIIKFKGGYHGHLNDLLAESGSGLSTLGIQSTPGVPEAFSQYTLTVPYNDAAALERVLEEQGEAVAAVVVEPVAGNMGCILPVPGFLTRLRALCTHYGVLLILDEVMTGFRVAWGGAQRLFDIDPDITLLGKIIGGGFPVAAVGGKRRILEHLAPEGSVYQAGTLSGNPVGMAAGLATLQVLREKRSDYASLSDMTQYLADHLRGLAKKHGIPCCVNRISGMLSVHFTKAESVQNYEQVAACDQKAFSQFFHAMLARGVYWPPSAFECAFLGFAHDRAVIDRTLACADRAFEQGLYLSDFESRIKL